MQLFGHRGAAGEAPENTIAGCLHAIERGVKRIEIDLQLSSDGQIVIVHDDTVNRTTKDKGRVKRFTARQLAAMDARQFGPQWPRKQDAGIPTLEELLQATKALHQYQLEVKPGPKAEMREIAGQLAERFKARREAARVIITSSDAFLLHEVGTRAPWLSRGMVATQGRHLNVAKDLGLQYFCARHTLCSAAMVRRAHAAGMHVSCWTVNEPNEVRRLHKAKVDSVISDYPSMVLPLLSGLERV